MDDSESQSIADQIANAALAEDPGEFTEQVEEETEKKSKETTKSGRPTADAERAQKKKQLSRILRMGIGKFNNVAHEIEEKLDLDEHDVAFNEEDSKDLSILGAEWVSENIDLRDFESAPAYGIGIIVGVKIISTTIKHSDRIYDSFKNSDFELNAFSGDNTNGESGSFNDGNLWEAEQREDDTNEETSTAG